MATRWPVTPGRLHCGWFPGCLFTLRWRKVSKTEGVLPEIGEGECLATLPPYCAPVHPHFSPPPHRQRKHFAAIYSYNVVAVWRRCRRLSPPYCGHVTLFEYITAWLLYKRVLIRLYSYKEALIKEPFAVIMLHWHFVLFKTFYYICIYDTYPFQRLIYRYILKDVWFGRRCSSQHETLVALFKEETMTSRFVVTCITWRHIRNRSHSPNTNINLSE